MLEEFIPNLICSPVTRKLTEEEASFVEKMADSLDIPQTTTEWSLDVPNEDAVTINIETCEFNSGKLEQLVEE